MMRDAAARLDIVIVNWNTGGALRECLASIAEARSPAVMLDRVVVVDNASTDDSLDRLPTGLPLTVVRNTVNRGFAAACNQGAAGSQADYLLFLNPDTRLFPDSLERPVAFLSDPAHADVGICGIRLVDESGAPVTSAARFPTMRVLMGEVTGLSRLVPSMFPRHLLSPAETVASRDVDQVIGAYFLIRAPLFRELEGFDERFFVYFEEVDLALRARQRGSRSYYLAEVSAIHIGGVSSGQVKPTRLFYSLRSRVLYARKHFTPAQARLLLAAMLAVEAPMRLAAGLAGGGIGGARGAWEAYRRFRAFLRAGGPDDRRESLRP